MHSPSRSPARRRGAGTAPSPLRMCGIASVLLGAALLLWMAWPEGYTPPRPMMFASTDSLDHLTKDRLMEALVRENRRLSVDCGLPDPATEPLSGLTLKPVNGADTAALQAQVAQLTAENEKLRKSLDEAKVALARASDALSLRGTAGGRSSALVSTPVAAAPPSSSIAATGSLPQVPSCSNQKLEFLRWTTDPQGRKLWCPFTPENYENWEKLPPLCDYISIECLGPGNVRAAHVFGFGGPGLMIGIADTLMWEFVFARHRTQRHMVELGTMTGGTSLYFGMAARVRGGTFHTFDRSENRPTEIRRGWLDNMHFHLEDILTGRTAANPNKAVVNVLDIKEPIIALFDNGDKRRETDIYARYLAVGSVLLLHDWEHLDLPKPHWEMTYSYVKKELEARGFVKAYFDFAEHIGSSTRAFIRKTPGPAH